MNSSYVDTQNEDDHVLYRVRDICFRHEPRQKIALAKLRMGTAIRTDTREATNRHLSSLFPVLLQTLESFFDRCAKKFDTPCDTSIHARHEEIDH